MSEQRRLNDAVCQFLRRCEQAQNDLTDFCDLIPYDTDDELLLDDVYMKINEAMALVEARFNTRK